MRGRTGAIRDEDANTHCGANNSREASYATRGRASREARGIIEAVGVVGVERATGTVSRTAHRRARCGSQRRPERS